MSAAGKVTPWTAIQGNGQAVEAAPLWYWITERMAIWTRRYQKRPRPWSEDPIFQQYRFCNVFRELDKVTVWIAENIRTPFAEHEHLWFMLAIARTINHPPTLHELMTSPQSWPDSIHFDPQAMTAVLQARKDRGEQVYTGAYMIRAESDKRKDWYSWSKQRYISEIVLGRLWEDRKVLQEKLEDCNRLEAAWDLLAKEYRYIGWGPFMTYEWVTDLRWTRYLRTARDKKSWANPGPGALRGLRRLQNGGKLEGSTISPKQAIEEMRRLRLLAPKYLPEGYGRSLEMRDIEHSLCEVDKYLRVFYNEGRPRAKFDGLSS